MSEEIHYDSKKAKHIFEHKKEISDVEHEKHLQAMAAILANHLGIDAHTTIERRNISDIREVDGKKLIKYHVNLCRGELFPIANLGFTLSPEGELEVVHLDNFSENKEIIETVDKGNVLVKTVNNASVPMAEREQAAMQLDEVFKKFRQLASDEEQMN